MTYDRLAAVWGDRARWLPLAALVAIAAGGALHLADRASVGDTVWAVTTAAMVGPLSWSVARTLARGDVGVDMIALVAMPARSRLASTWPGRSSPSCSRAGPRSRPPRPARAHRPGRAGAEDRPPTSR